MSKFYAWLTDFRPEAFFVPRHPPTRWLALAFIILIFDQFTKLLVLYYLEPYEQLPWLPVLNITLLFNRGAAFSFLAGANGWQQWLFVVLAVAFSIAILVWLRRLPARGRAWLAAGLALILAGALGNAIDRVWHGHVIDFIQVHYSDTWYFPTFNIADAAITVGAILAIVDALFHRRAKPGSDESQDSQPQDNQSTE
ncbi:MAG: signal peptidase II [Gammaproteobacteria bacterium]|nr:signal peptidase II [Gammaproteobacteria bacterium]